MCSLSEEVSVYVTNDDVTQLQRVLTSKNINMTVNDRRATLLMWAVGLRKYNVVEFLLSRGASLYPRDIFYYNVFHHAAWHADARIMKLLLYSAGVLSNDDWQHVMSISRADRPSFRPGARALLDLPHPRNGRTPLMFAALKGNVELVDFLITEAGADVSLKDYSGNSVMDIAAQAGHKEVVMLLLARCSDDHGVHFDKTRRNAEENCYNAATLQQLNTYNEIKTLLCQEWLSQSTVSFL
uniref:WGS project CAEQ00000000 data, annotated contig 129 n=1 Tax=Trypanosoma congolense (strain IL3000) TaxID=1068625 RepID=F9W596_TRYCI|nr:unnamed protein product [Trypanosoma congolense IL3000]